MSLVGFHVTPLSLPITKLLFSTLSNVVESSNEDILKDDLVLILITFGLKSLFCSFAKDCGRVTIHPSKRCTTNRTYSIINKNEIWYIYRERVCFFFLLCIEWIM